jgi:hypothetical protein
MHDLQPKHFLKGIEIVVSVQQFVPGFQTKSGNQTIDSLSDGVPALAQVSVVLGGGNGQGTTADLKNLEPKEFGLDSRELVLVPNPLQYLAKNEICQPEPLPLQFAIQPTCFWIFGAPQIVDPHRGVDDDHRPAYSRTRVRRDWSRSPSQSTFPRSLRIEP